MEFLCIKILPFARCVIEMILLTAKSLNFGSFTKFDWCCVPGDSKETLA